MENKKIIELGDALMALTTSEALDLQNYLESKGLKPAQPTTVVAASVAAVEEKKESENVNLVLINKGTAGLMGLVKALKGITGKEAMELKKLTDALPATILTNVQRLTANQVKNDLVNEFGDTLVIELQDC